jgi:hypothetical protein
MDLDGKYIYKRGRYPELPAFMCSRIRNLHKKFIKNLIKIYEWIVHIIFYQPVKF